MVFLLEKTSTLYGAVLGHIGANLITVLRTETGILDWMNSSTAVFWIATVVMAVVCAGISWLIWKDSKMAFITVSRLSYCKKQYERGLVYE